MEQNMNISLSSFQVGQSGKGSPGLAHPSLQEIGSPLQFGELVLDASGVKLLWMNDSDASVNEALTSNLKHQISGLSADFESQLAVASQQNADPEVVEEILSQVISQLWMLLDEFDVQHGTHLVLGLSENLQRSTPDTDGTFLVEVDDPNMGRDGSVFSQILSLLIVSELSASSVTAQPVAAATGSIRLTAAVNEPQTLPQGQLSEKNAVSFSNPSSQENKQPFPVEIPLKGPISNTNVTVDLTNIANRSALQNLMPGQQAGGSPISNLQENKQPLPAGTSITGPSSNTNVTVDLVNIASRSTLQSQLSGQQATGLPASDLPRSIHPLSTGNLMKNPGSNSTLTADSVNKMVSVTSSFVSGIDIGAKFKELLLGSAGSIASGKEAFTSIGEIGSALISSKSDVPVVQAPAKPEHLPPPSSFSKNIANQILDVTINMGRTRIELAPRGLGSIIIDLHPKDSGGLQITLRAETPAVLHALRADREVLLAVLSNGDVQQDKISLDFESFGQSQFQQGKDSVETSGPNPDQTESEQEDNQALTLDHLVGLGQLDFFT